MKITKKIESEIKIVMQDFWEAYLEGNLDNWANYLVSEYRNIGTTEVEIWKSKKEVYDYSASIADQMVGLTEIRNKKMELIPYDPYVMVHEYFDIYIKTNEKWTFYSKLRLSSLIQKIDNAWKILHQHGSYPDSKVTDGEFFAFDTIKSENLKLQEAVKNRTAELEEKNRELEIEASLERVRTVAMGMQKADDLMEVSKALLTELNTLGFQNLRNTQIDIFNDDKRSFLNYEYSDYGVNGVTEVFYDSHPLVEQFVKDIRSASDALSYLKVTGTDLDEWRNHRKQTKHLPDPKLEKAKSLYYYCYSIGTGALGISSYEPIGEDKLDLLKRFRDVFNLAYRRYIDIKKAEEQAREAQIEVSLERVRTVAMSMNKPEDLLSICEVSFNELQKLGFDNLRNAVIHVLNDEQKYFMDYDFSDFTGGKIGKIEYGLHPIVDEYLKKIRSAEDAFFEVVIADDMLEDWNEFRRKSGQMNDQRLDKAEALYYYLFSIGIGDIGISTFKPINESQIKILKRFRNVFDLAYRRYNDITLAEAQAREAQIEAALERVRAHAMGLRSSEELRSIIAIIFDELRKLGLQLYECGIFLRHGNTRDFTFWGSGSDEAELPTSYHFHFFKHPILDSVLHDLDHKIPYREISVDKDELLEYGELLFTLTDLKNSPQEYKDSYYALDKIYVGQALMQHGFLEAVGTKPLPDDLAEVMRRFTNVIDLTYTRFLDLQKAEAQAREAKVEAALERVRSLALGMRKSEEVGNVTDRLFTELVNLSVDVTGCSIVVIDEDTDKMELWRARSNVAVKPVENSSFKKAMGLLKKNMPDWYSTFFKALSKRKSYLLDELSGERRLKFINTIVEQYNYSEAEKIQLLKNAPEKINTHYIFFKLGYLALLAENKLSDENLSIARRFVEVFEFSYTRFLDIKLAEEQAREAKIEASLEKVRSVALSLKKSDEMLNIAQVLYEQLLELGFTNIRNALIDIKNGDDDTFTDYDYSHEMSGTITQMSYQDDPTLQGQFKKMATTTNDFFELVLEGKELEDLKAMRIKNGEAEDPRLNSIDVLTYNLYSFGNGAIGISNFGVLSEEEKSILNRFSNVFTFAYKRYTDLVKAEIQARETQIELSLERIRAQITSMKESDEILELVVRIRNEFVSLGYDAAYFWYMKWTPDKYLKAMTSGDGTQIGMVMELPRKIHGEIKNLAEWEKSNEPTVVHVMDVEATLDYVHKMAEWGDFKQIDPNMPTEEDIRKMGGLTYIMARTMHGEIGYSLPGMVPNPPDDALSTLVRFAKVFDLAYSRFEDLKKSEQQFRESQIELGLERVRAKAMAMHSPEDLSSAINTFFIELKTLGITPIRCGVGQIDESTRTTNLTTTTSAKQGKSFEVIGKVKQTGHPVLDGIFDNWKIQKDYFPVLEGSEIKKYYSVMNKQIPYPDYPEDITQYGNVFYFKEGFVFAWTEEKLSEEELQIFRRFTSVLSLTYTRYIDLQQAELRARDAEQQASLDRVRGEIASMRTTEDLEKITPLIWSELTKLNINFFRCGVFIIDEPSQIVKVYLTTPAGKSLAALHLPFNTSQLVKQSVKFWKKRKVYKEQWNREQFIAWSKSLVEQGHIKNTSQYQGGEKPPESLSLQFLPFTQGMLYVGSAAKLTEEEIETAQKLAESFGVAYARYEDFQKLEAANKRKSSELEEARQLQLAMLPKKLPQLPNLDIAVYMQTATEVGGDYYDFYVGEKGGLTAVIGDATGHGMKAGTIVTITKSLFNSSANDDSILNTFSKISKVIKEMKFRQLSMCLMMLKIKDDFLRICSAAMPPALIYRKKKNTVEEIELKGMPLGAIENFPYQIEESKIAGGDTILLMSDGLPELHSSSNKMYGYDRIMNEFHTVGNRSPEEIIDHLKKSAAEWINGNDPDDDITFVVIKVK
ncbi:MAG: SpoIIE family protein phosphatase [Ignavibacteriae bacterium]|nr:hypothetical protein [Ignavibacteriota bacterium]NOG99176.1 SpoIIE family protein phosphatase [Ignavibacteriota bacterium]